MSSTIDPVYLHWPISKFVDANWGDKLNPALVGFLSGREVVHAKELPEDAADPTVYSVIGSHIARSQSHWVIWGTGFISSDQEMRATPKKICSVRGPGTKAKLESSGIACPAVFGDAAVFYPAMHAAERTEEYDLGIIQHTREAGVEPLPRMDDSVRVRVIDINGGLEQVIDEIVSCKRIVSSSLHGIIASHAYGVPAAWIKFSDRPVGDGFKFRDYWESVGVPNVSAVNVNGETSVKDLVEIRSPLTKTLDIATLIDCCPFMADDRKHAVSQLMQSNFKMADIIGA